MLSAAKVLFKLSVKSWRNRRLSIILTILSIAFSVMLLVGIERVRLGARESFSNTISQTDLIVGARGGSVQLLLYSVFHIGQASNNISFNAYNKIVTDPSVAWSIPISLGDSHKGFRVIATNENYYDHLRYHDGRALEFTRGSRPKENFDVVLGADVEQKLGYKLGDPIVITHGLLDSAFALQHKANPFKVAGILARTNTPVDRGLYISLEAMEAIHGQKDVHQITAFYIGATSRIETLGLQRQVNEFTDEPLMAIIPGVALSDLWSTFSYAEDALKAVSFFVVLVGAMGLWIAIHSSLADRRREMAILRAIGAEPVQIFLLFIIESVLLGFCGILSGLALVYTLLFIARPMIEARLGFFLPLHPPQELEWMYLTGIEGLCFIVGFLPALSAYKTSLSDGLVITS